MLEAWLSPQHESKWSFQESQIKLLLQRQCFHQPRNRFPKSRHVVCSKLGYPQIQWSFIISANQKCTFGDMTSYPQYSTIVWTKLVLAEDKQPLREVLQHCTGTWKLPGNPAVWAFGSPGRFEAVWQKVTQPLGEDWRNAGALKDSMLLGWNLSQFAPSTRTSTKSLLSWNSPSVKPLEESPTDQGCRGVSHPKSI